MISSGCIAIDLRKRSFQVWVIKEILRIREDYIHIKVSCVDSYPDKEYWRTTNTAWLQDDVNFVYTSGDIALFKDGI